MLPGARGEATPDHCSSKAPEKLLCPHPPPPPAELVSCPFPLPTTPSRATVKR